MSKRSALRLSRPLAVLMLALLALLVGPSALQAQTAERGAAPLLVHSPDAAAVVKTTADPAVPDAIDAVSAYSFSQFGGTYSAITGGSTLGVATNDDTLFPNIAIGFSFNYDGTSYTTVGVCSNGYIVMGLNTGSSCGSPYTPISSTTYNNLISALGRDLQGNTTTGELRYETQGTAPNRTFTVQWTSYRKYSATGDNFNFQITLYETSNVVEVKYGDFTVNATSSTVQVGLKGASTSDYNNRTTTTDWSASTAGGSNAATMTLSGAVKPASGQTYQWTPPSGPPACAINPAPADAATAVAINTNLAWAAGGGGGVPTSYDVYFGASGTPPFVVNVASSPYSPGTLAYSTTYYWQIVPKNADGSAAGCPIWSFTTEPDPTVTVFPYSQDFNGASVPGWTQENTNGDAYVWGLQITYRRGTTGAAAAIRWNTTLAMDDWLFTPPLQLMGGVTYGVRFFYRAASSTYPEKMEVKWGSAASSAGMTNGPIFDDSNIVNTVMKEAIATFTPAANGVYYVGFHGYSAADMFYLVVDDVTVYDTADSVWEWQGGTDSDWFKNANWEGSIVPGELDEVKIPVFVRAPSAVSPLIGTSSEASYGRVYNLTVDAGAQLEVAAVTNLNVLGALTNNGTLLQAKSVPLGSPATSFLNHGGYGGVSILENSIALGSTTVAIRGNQPCTLSPTHETILRCFDISAATPSGHNADVTFFFFPAELGSQTCETLNVYHWTGTTWEAEIVTERQCTTSPYSVKATGVSDFSPFALASQTPNAIELLGFTAEALGLDAVRLNWETATEVNLAGYFVYRSASPDVLGDAVNAQMIASQGVQGQGAAYELIDANLTPGVYYYTLEDVDLSGFAARHGPVMVEVGSPSAVGLQTGATAGAPGGLPAVLFAVALLLTVAAVWLRRRAA